MTDISQSDWSEADASNNSTPPDGWPSSTMLPTQVEPAARAIRGAIKRFWDRIQGVYASTGSANAYVLTPTAALGAYVTGERYSFRSNFANTGAATLNISGLGAKTIKKMTASGKADLASGDIQSGQPVTVEYDGTDLIVTTALAVITNALLAQMPANTIKGNNTGSTANAADLTVAQVAALLSITGMSDYAEGSWTPTVEGTSTAGTQTYSTQVGRYVRIGNIVHFFANVVMTAKDGTTAGNIQMGGLPFTSSNISGLRSAVCFSAWTNVTLTASYTSVAGQINENTTKIVLLQNSSGVGAATIAVSNLSAASAFIFSGSYRIN